VIGRGLITLLGVSLIVFAAIHLIPGSFVDAFVPLDAPPEFRERVASEYGLDRPLPVQYALWAGSTVSGDLGTSLRSRRPVGEELRERLPATIQLTAMAMGLALLIGIPLGIAAGLAPSSVVGSLARAIGALGPSIPYFVIASVFVYVFSIYVVGNYVAFTTDPVANLRSMILPAVALSVATTSLILRTTRDSVLTVMPELYISAALSRGESLMQLVRRHVVRNATIPVLTVAVVNAGHLLGGAVLTETIFSIPGLGFYAVRAIGGRDYPVVLACVLLGAAVFVTMNTLADLAYPLIDPRIRARRQGR
jgi:peptide/nickel transport system permease protein